MFKHPSKLNRSVTALLLAVGLCALVGFEQSCSALPLTAEGGAGWSRTTISNTDDDGRKITLELEGGKVVKATVDGKKVPSDRVKIDGDQIVILGDDGKEVVRVAKPGTGWLGSGHSWIVSDHFGDAKMAQAMKKMHSTWRPGDTTFPAEPPKVMLGVLMADAEGPLAEHFGLSAQDATVITSVNSDMPAGKAGIKAYNIVVAIDGKSPAGMKAFREAMSKKNADDTVTFTVISAGQRKDVSVKLVKFDDEKLRKAFPQDTMKDGPFLIEPGAATPPGEPLPPGAVTRVWPGVQGAPAISPTRDRDLEKKLQQLDERLEKLEAMLEKLIERKP